MLKRPANLMFSLPLCALMGLAACSPDDSGSGGDETAGTETGGTETGDTVGTGDGDGDDTTTTTTGDGDGDDPACPIGSEGCPCTPGGGCDPGLTCEVGVCVPGDDPTTTGDGDGDATTTGDGDGDATTTGDGDGDPNTACAGDEFLDIDITAFADADGWDVTQSMILQGADILAWDQQTQNAFVSFSIDVPCDDTWHVWVRGLNGGNNDSYFVTVDGQPDPEAIFEIACDQGPQQPTYEWRELNYREQGAGACEYLFDPWTQDWAAGAHDLTFIYRESIAIADIWITNTEQTPP